MRKLTTEEMDRLSVKEFQATEKTNIVLVLDNIRSMHNVGTAFRTGDAFLIEKIYLCGITGSPPHREIQKTALGATESVVWEHIQDTTEALKRLREEGYTLIALEQTDSSVSLQDFQPQKTAKYALSFWQRSLWRTAGSSQYGRGLRRNTTVRNKALLQCFGKHWHYFMGFFYENALKFCYAQNIF